MNWIGNKIEKFRQLPTPYIILHVMSRFVGGVGLGVLLTTWLPVWTGWLFIGVAGVIVIPSARILLSK